jgi:hypothetical protein|tara:strand:- start:2192 stop:2386 length:195 start_codon:yes stop_codon:yes gene_type:complete
MKTKNRKMMENGFYKFRDTRINEAHEDTDEGKIDYIQKALSNLNSESLDKVYLFVEDLDPNYEK